MVCKKRWTESEFSHSRKINPERRIEKQIYAWTTASGLYWKAKAFAEASRNETSYAQQRLECSLLFCTTASFLILSEIALLFCHHGKYAPFFLESHDDRKGGLWTPTGVLVNDTCGASNDTCGASRLKPPGTSSSLGTTHARIEEGGRCSRTSAHRPWTAMALKLYRREFTTLYVWFT